MKTTITITTPYGAVTIEPAPREGQVAMTGDAPAIDALSEEFPALYEGEITPRGITLTAATAAEVVGHIIQMAGQAEPETPTEA